MCIRDRPHAVNNTKENSNETETHIIFFMLMNLFFLIHFLLVIATYSTDGIIETNFSYNSTVSSSASLKSSVNVSYDPVGSNAIFVKFLYFPYNSNAVS